MIYMDNSATSPVKEEVFNVELPWIIIPSVGIVSPGLINTYSLLL